MALTETELSDLIDDLASHWEEAILERDMHQPAARRDKVFSGGDASRITAVMGLTRHTYVTAKAVQLLLENGMMAQAIPLVRLAYECSLTAVHLVQSEGQHGILAFLHEHSRIRAAFQKDAQASISATFREGAASVANTDTTPFEGSYDSMRNFHQVCMDLEPGGKDAFLYYRLLSNYSHASVGVADLYFETNDNPSEMPTVRDTPKFDIPVSSLYYLTAISLVWSGRAFNYLSRDKSHRSFLRSCARQLGVEEDLKLSEHYWKRHARRAKEKREAKT